MVIQATAQFYSVGAVVRYLRGLMEEDEQLQDLWVRGEVSQFTQASSGHWYFNLKDDEGLLSCVIYRQRNFGMPRLSPGQEIFAHGKMSFYAPRGTLQFMVDQIEDVGVGALYQRFQALKEELEALGLFDAERKRPIPVSPATIGLVTSADAAALRDIIRTLRLRWPLARVLLAPTLVQGDKAPQQIVQALTGLNQHAGVEVIIIARGGGSMEDLWAFNDRAVALAIANSRIPTVTGIGHETDFTIADFVADYRAATPTAAAAAVSPDITSLRIMLDDARMRLLGGIHDRLDSEHDALATALHQLEREHPREQVDHNRRQLAEGVAALRRQLTHRLAMEHERLSGAALRMQSLSPLLTMARGYAAITRDRDGAPVASINDVAPPEAITLRLRDGEASATVNATRPLS